MAVAKLNCPTHVMKVEDAADSLDTLMKQSPGRESFYSSYSRTNDNPVQWIQLLQALDQPDLPGWPLLTPLKVQMQKCDKCSREFCSSINYRRHMRVHHRWKKFNKDCTKHKDLLGSFWDKLSEDEMKEILSFKDLTLEEVPGSSIIKSLMALVRKPGFSSLPQYCLRAGSALLDIIHARSQFPLPSKELFNILDDASEKTFLCGTASSVQNYIFGGEAGKVGLETKNLVACTSFLMEQKLIKAWIADKDAEALRCQKLLVEEEEAAQRRQAELLERKRQKKLRQREHKAKEQRQDENADIKDRIDDTQEAVTPAEQSYPWGGSVYDAHDLEKMPDHIPLYHEPFLPPKTGKDVDLEIKTGHSSGSGSGHDVERHILLAINRRHMARWSLPSKQWNHTSHGFRASNSPTQRLSTMQKNAIHRDPKSVPLVNGNKRWSQKHQPECSGESLKTGVHKEAVSPSDNNKKTEVLIGSISVSIGNCNHHGGSSADGVPNDFLEEHQVPKKNNSQEKHSRMDSVQCGASRSLVKIWRPVCQNGMKGPMVFESECQVDRISVKCEDQIPTNDTYLRPCSMDNLIGTRSSSTLLEENLQSGSTQFSCHTAKAFLAERWKAAIATDHVRLVLPPTFEADGCVEVQNGCQVAAAESSDVKKQDNAVNRGVDVGVYESSAAGVGKAKFRTKPVNGIKSKYTPKQRTIT